VPGRDDQIPTGRILRTAKVGGLVAGQAARAAATRAANVARSDPGARAAAERRQAEAAEQIVEVLGEMKGAAMKVGQVASFIDTGAFPPDAQERFQQKLAELRDAAPRVSFPQMRAVVEADLGRPLEDAFASFDPDAVAAASIGQVYRAELRDGRRVAVKVQYPGVAAAVRADLQNLGLLLRAARRLAPGMDPKAIAGEVRERVTEELDYEHEAQNQRAFERAWRGHPFVVVPGVVGELCTERVLVTEWVDGTGFEDLKRLPAAVRNRVGEIVLRFFFGSLYRTGHFSGDPHPGNFLLMDDGRVAFLDFGMTKTVPREQVAGEVEVLRAGMLGEADGLHRGLGALGFFDLADPVLEPARVLAHFRAATGWYLEDRDFTFDPEYVGRVMIDIGDPRSEFWDLMKRETVPPDALLGRRMEAMVVGVLGQLRATANWHRIVREWFFAAPPATPLGEQEAAYWCSRGVAPVPLDPPAERAA
jgi:predicted unusual protein kinase regulating ubiquinone biosynthesis (AarF/ABC1/UbiB family)